MPRSITFRRKLPPSPPGGRPERGESTSEREFEEGRGRSRLGWAPEDGDSDWTSWADPVASFHPIHRAKDRQGPCPHRCGSVRIGCLDRCAVPLGAVLADRAVDERHPLRLVPHLETP